MATAREFVDYLAASLDIAAREQFRPLERLALLRSLEKCGMTEYPRATSVNGAWPNEDGHWSRASGECTCEVCGREYREHPMDWRIIEYGNRPFLNVLCDGRRVKL